MVNGSNSHPHSLQFSFHFSLPFHCASFLCSTSLHLASTQCAASQPPSDLSFPALQDHPPINSMSHRHRMRCSREGGKGSPSHPLAPAMEARSLSFSVDEEEPEVFDPQLLSDHLSIHILEAQHIQYGSDSRKHPRNLTLSHSSSPRPRKTIDIPIKIMADALDNGRSSSMEGTQGKVTEADKGTHSTSTPELAPHLSKKDDTLSEYGCFIVEETPQMESNNI